MGYDFTCVDFQIEPTEKCSDAKLAALLAELQAKFPEYYSFLQFDMDAEKHFIEVYTPCDDAGYSIDDELQAFAEFMKKKSGFVVRGTAHFEDGDVARHLEFNDDNELEEAECKWLEDCAVPMINILQDIANTHDYVDIRWFADLDRHDLRVIRDWYTEYLQK